MEEHLLYTQGVTGSRPVPPIPMAMIAEKLHALTRTYEGGRTSTRTKDLVDIALIATLAKLDAETLKREIDAVFALRDTHPAPYALPLPPPDWTEPFR